MTERIKSLIGEGQQQEPERKMFKLMSPFKPLIKTCSYKLKRKNLLHINLTGMLKMYYFIITSVDV